MKKKMQLTQREFDQFEDYLRHDEREESTIEAYLRSLTRFAEWADGRVITREPADQLSIKERFYLFVGE